ncbi:ComEC/Rec2 family competence protein [Chitinophaga polysaccharea]|uniref:ComEC/Rec2 family competence protein n=1 Tax=Chitinophaga polysaccharea TaxID=1293035 RepID=UPI00115A4218|nr:ComEC/Rec2 family competence protein [Chitinophaga polysaccharea]
MEFESTLFVVMCWKRAPFLRIIVPLVAGIILQLYVPLYPTLYFALAGSCIAAVLAFRYLPLQWRFTAAWLPGTFIFILICCCGGLLMHKADLRHSKGFYGYSSTNDTPLYLLRINEPPQETLRSFKTIAQVMAVQRLSEWMPVKGYLLLYTGKDNGSQVLRYGDELIVRKRPESVKFNGNPGAFDYQQFLVTQQVYQQLYLRPHDFYRLPHNRGQPVQQLLLQAREYCLSNLKKYIGNGPEAGMAEALLIGYRQDLDREVVRSYSNTGIVHVIAISGMHLALLYGTLLWLLQWLPVHRWINITRAVIVLLVLWGFALLTGASASVLRSAVMFTGITIGRFILYRHSSIYNTLAASATMLLCFNPYLVADAGFQLSYLAVLGILLFYQPVYQLLQCKYRWADWLWQMTAVSLAAQITTTPVSLFYFHQFPNYFLPANLLAVPLSTLIIYGEVILLFIAPFGGAAVWLGKTLKYLIFLMNSCVGWIGELPGALIRNIHCSLAQTLLLYLLIAGLALWLLVKFRPGLWTGLFCTWAFLIVRVHRIMICRQQCSLIVYNVPAYTAIDCVKGNNVQFAGNDSVWQLPVAQQLLNARSDLRVQTGSIATFQRYGRFLSFQGKKLLIIDSMLPGRLPPEKFRTNYILLTCNPPVSIQRLSDFYTFDTLILAASNSSWRIRKWKSECEMMRIRYYSIGEQGAFVLKLR